MIYIEMMSYSFLFRQKVVFFSYRGLRPRTPGLPNEFQSLEIDVS